MEMLVRRTQDFELTGRGDAPAWAGTEWQELQHVEDGPAMYPTRVKVLYSDTGIYFLFDCKDRILSATRTRDNDDINLDDVVEIYLWPDESKVLYFEHQVSALNAELTLIIPNHQGTFFGWAAWHYEGPRRCRHAVSVVGGERKSMARIDGWLAETFVPFALLTGLGNSKPAPGMKWRANMYRQDYDDGHKTQWAWCPDTGGKFHDYWKFGTILFE